jgi:hypothetical protein
MNRDRRNAIRASIALGFWCVLLVAAYIGDKA